MKLVRKVLAVVSITLCLDSEATAQSTGATWRGQLLNSETKTAISGARLTAINSKTRSTMTAVSAEDGQFEFSNLEPGPYNIYVERAGFMASPTFQEIKSGEKVERNLYASWLPWNPPVELFGAISLASHDNGDDRTAAFGWQTSVTLPRLAELGAAFSDLGFIADFGGQYRDGGRSYQFLAGPEFRTRAWRVSLALHTLAGVERLDTPLTSSSGFMMGLGGGLNLRMSRHLTWRIAQFDWLPNRHAGDWSWTDIRYGFGLVLPVGNRER